MNVHALDGKWILVTGASSGLGQEIATQLARDYHSNLIVVARRKERLEKLKNQLESDYGIQVAIESADLSLPDAATQLYKLIIDQYDIFGVVLNAGVTYFGKDKNMDNAVMQGIVATNIATMASLMHGFVSYFENGQRAGAMLVVSSMAALFPVPYQALYSGSKAFIYNYAVALNTEITNPDFSITVFAPGGIKTEMTATESFHELEKWLMTKESAAKAAIEGLVKRKVLVIPGNSNRIGAKLMRLIPSSFLLKRMGKIYQKALQKSEKE